VQLDYFNGFPYMITVVSKGLFHLAVLPPELGLDNLREIVRWQIGANKLRSCLVLGSSSCVYFGLDGAESISANIPRGGTNCCDRLRMCRALPESADLAVRRQLLHDYVEQNGMTDIVYSDLAKGGYRATPEELARLRGRQPNGVPQGLVQCGVCGEWRGESLDPNPRFSGLVMLVRCRCENDTACAACGQSLHERRIDANYYDENDGQIHHVPGFAAFDHACAVAAGRKRRRNLPVHAGPRQYVS